jgi:hypothetical protein
LSALPSERASEVAKEFEEVEFAASRPSTERARPSGNVDFPLDSVVSVVTDIWPMAP